MGALLGFAAYSANSLAARFKPDIERAASNALHASVSLGALSVSVFPSVQVNVEEARIVAQPGSADVLSLRGLVLHVNLLPLLSRRVVIETVSLDEPVVTIVRTKAGMFIEGLPRPHAAAESAPSEEAAVPRPPAPSAGTQAAAAASGLRIDLHNFEINNATLTLRDAVTGTDLSLAHINMATAVSMTGDNVMVTSLTMRADLPGGHRVSISGTGQSFNPKIGQLALGDVKASIPGGVVRLAGTVNVNTLAGDVMIVSDGINLNEAVSLAAALAPAAANIDLRGTIKTDLKATFGAGAYLVSGNVTLQDIAFKHGTASVSGIAGQLVLGGDASKQTVATDGLAFVFKDKPATVRFSAVIEGDTVRIDPLTLAALSGSLSGDGESSLSPPFRFTTRVEGSGFSVAEAMDVANPGAAMKMEGVVTRLAVNTGGSGAGDVTRSLEGTAAFGMKDGVLKGFNLAAAVLQAANKIPLLAGAIDTPKFQKHLASKDTRIESLTGDFTIASGWIETRNLKIVGELFTLAGSGRVSFQTDLDLATTITFNREISQAMIGRAKQLRPVLNDDGTLSIPAIVKGRPPNVNVQPDVERLIAGSTKNVLEGTVGKALEKALTDEKAGGKLLDRLFGK
jgi:uncharacterized protein involved in outer membrane biogenesis